MIDFIGWLGAMCFAVCAIPQALHCYKHKSAVGVNFWFWLLWIVGEVLMLVYILATTAQLPLIVNYVFNLGCLSVIGYYLFGGKR